MTVTNSVNTNTYLRGVPAVSPIYRLTTYCNNQILDQINDYGVLYNTYVNSSMSIAQKVGAMGNLGFLDGSTTPSFVNMNGRSMPLTTGDTYTVAFPLINILSGCEKLIPLFMCGGIRLEFALDSVANIFTATTIANVGYTINSFEVVYDSISFGSSIENLIKSGAMGQKFYIKSQSYYSSGASLATATSGSVSLQYNARLSSIKSLIALFAGQTAAVATNAQYDSYDITNSNGQIWFSVAGVNYPQKPIDTLTNKASVLVELKAVIAGIHHARSNDMSITAQEFALAGTTASSSTVYGKFYFGINCERCAPGDGSSLLTGINSHSSPISLNLALNSATTQGFNIMVIANYDALLEFDVEMKSLSVKQ